jgi:hypothetical protein
LQQFWRRRVLFPNAEQKAMTSTRQKAFSGVVYTDFPFDGSGKRVGWVIDASQQIYNAAFSHVSTSLSRAFFRQKSRFDLNSAQLSSS